MPRGSGGEVMSSSGTRAGGRSILVVIALGISIMATSQLAPDRLDETLRPIELSDEGDPLDSRPLGTPDRSSGLRVDLDENQAATPDVPPAGPNLDDPNVHANVETPPLVEDDWEPALDDNSAPEGLSENPGIGNPSAPAEPGSTVLRLVYFVEADREFDPAAVDAIERQAEALQAFWYEQFGGTFRLPAGGVDVVYGEHPAVWYDQTSAGENERWNRLANIRDEVRRELGIPDGTASVRLLTYPDARIDGRVGANRYEGAWMDGDDISCVSSIVESTPYSRDYPAGCLATVAHELGHVYGLGHAGEDVDCMQYGFYFYVSGEALCDFGAANRALVQADPRNAGWLDALPGDRR